MFPCNQSCLSSRTQPDPAFGQPSSSPKKKPSEPHRSTPAKGLSSKFHFWGPKLLFQSQFSLCGSVLLPQGTPGLMSRRGSALRWDRALFLLLIIARIGDFFFIIIIMDFFLHYLLEAAGEPAPCSARCHPASYKANQDGVRSSSPQPCPAFAFETPPPSPFLQSGR